MENEQRLQLLRNLISSTKESGLSRLALKKLIRNDTFPELLRMAHWSAGGEGTPEEVEALRHSIEKDLSKPEELG